MATKPDAILSPEVEPAFAAARTLEVANDNTAARSTLPFDAAWRRYASTLPADASAIIEPDPLSGRAGGRARNGRWRLRFRERSRPFVDPLTGWTGGCDPLANVNLVFRSREAAEAYCQRNGVAFESRPAPANLWRRPRDGLFYPEAGVPSCCMPAGPHPLCCGSQGDSCRRGGHVV